MMTFQLTDEQEKKFRYWAKRHKCSIPGNEFSDHYVGAIGGRFNFEFIPTSMGDIITVKCACGKEKVFADL